MDREETGELGMKEVGSRRKKERMIRKRGLPVCVCVCVRDRVREKERERESPGMCQNPILLEDR